VKPTDLSESHVDPGAHSTLARPARLAETMTANPLGQVDPGLSSSESDAFASSETFTTRYELREKLGEGGMGEVHLVLDRRIGREVALKAVHPGHRTRPDLHARFVREARVQGQLEHPSIVPVYELARESDAAYFTMRRVRGVTLEQVIDALRAGDPDYIARFSRRKLLTAFDNVCLAVDFAHARGVVHRDLKPSNVMLGDFGEVHILDWGVAKVGDMGDPLERVSVDIEDPKATTEAGAFMGTLGYIAPEQLRGEAVTPQADVYALGATLFEILAYTPLHSRARSTEIVSSTLEGVDARPSVRAADRDVPPELEAICVKATERDPARRFSSAREMHDAIERFLDGDRDVEQRRELARRHARAALEAAARATDLTGEGAAAARTLALKEAARSLALDPTNTEAMEATLRLRAQPPRTFPREVESQLAQSDEGVRRSSAWFAAVAFGILLVYAPLSLLMGLLDLPFSICTALLFIASGAILIARARRPREGQVPVLIVVSTLAFALQARVAGPFVLLPGLIVANTVAYAMLENRVNRYLAVAAGCLALVVPALLEWMGTFGASYVFHDGTITIVPRVLAFPKTPTFVYLTLTSLGCMFVPFLYVARLRAQLYDMRRTTTLQAWQFRQLVPEQVQEVAGAAPVVR
jgi:eukaryotic-like serine/threonine-protein kinase